jgi:Flp pilus assembly protein TadG
MLFVGLIIFAGRVTIAHQAVESAANEAARAASIARTQGDAGRDATSSARTSLTNQKVNCRSVRVTVDVSDFDQPVGTPGTVTATVTCRVDLSDVSVPGVPGTKTVTATMSSPLDTYREKTRGFSDE